MKSFPIAKDTQLRCWNTALLRQDKIKSWEQLVHPKEDCTRLHSGMFLGFLMQEEINMRPYVYKRIRIFKSLKCDKFNQRNCWNCFEHVFIAGWLHTAKCCHALNVYVNVFWEDIQNHLQKVCRRICYYSQGKKLTTIWRVVFVL